MNAHKINYVFGVLLAVFVGSTGLAATSLNYGGNVADTDGKPLNGSYDMKFNFYSAMDAIDVLFSISKTRVSFENGLFNAELPLTTTTLEQVKGSVNLYIEVELVSPFRVFPRQKYNYVPYAIFASGVKTDNDTIQVNAQGALFARGNVG